MRRAKERDYRGVAEIRGVIIPVGMSGATGFLGNKVVIDSPEEAERRLLMAKVGGIMYAFCGLCRFSFRGCGAVFLGNVKHGIFRGSGVSSRQAPLSFRRRCAVGREAKCVVGQPVGNRPKMCTNTKYTSVLPTPYARLVSEKGDRWRSSASKMSRYILTLFKTRAGS